MAPKQDKNAVSFEEIIQKGALRCDAMRCDTTLCDSFHIQSLLDGHVLCCLFFLFETLTS